MFVLFCSHHQKSEAGADDFAHKTNSLAEEIVMSNVLLNGFFVTNL